MQKSLSEIIRDLEMLLISPVVRGSVETLDQLLSDDFVEFGSSGRIYSKEDLLNLHPQEEEISVQIEGFNVKGLSPNVVLATYKSVSEGKSALRSSIWTCVEGEWKMIFHQGTPC